MKLSINTLRSITIILLLISFVFNINFYNEIQALKIIVKTNTDLINDAKIRQAINEVRIYEKNGTIPSNDSVENKKLLKELQNE